MAKKSKEFKCDDCGEGLALGEPHICSRKKRFPSLEERVSKLEEEIKELKKRT